MVQCSKEFLKTFTYVLDLAGQLTNAQFNDLERGGKIILVISKKDLEVLGPQ